MAIHNNYFEPVSSTLPMLPTLSNHHPHTSTPFCGTRTLPHNKTFDISQITPLTCNPQDVATIAAEVSAAEVVQASKEFCHMCKPKITKFKGRYSADAELSFHSWHADILAHITDCDLDNKLAIQLIKDQVHLKAHAMRSNSNLTSAAAK